MSTPRFLADEDLRRAIVLATRRADPSIVFSTVVELGLGGATDQELLEFSNAGGWLLVSHDANTMKADAEERTRLGQGMKGFFLAPQTRSTRSVADSLHLIWFASELEEWENQVVYLPF